MPAARTADPNDTGSSSRTSASSQSGSSSRPLLGRRWEWWWGPAAGAAPFLLAITVLGRSAQNMGQTTYPLIARQLLDFSNTLVGTVTAVAGLAGVLTAATLAARSTAKSALPMLAIGQSLVLASFVLFALPTGAVGLWAGALVLGVGGGLVFPAAMTWIGTGPPEKRARALAIFAVSLSIGLVVGPLVESGVLHLLGNSLRSAFAAMLPLPALATALSVAGARNRSAKRPARQTDHWSDEDPAGASNGPGRPVRDGVLPEGLPGPRHRTSSGIDQERPGVRPTDQPENPPVAPRRLLGIPAYRLSLATMLTYQAPFAALVTFGGLLARHVDGASAAGVELAFGVFFAVSLGVRGVVVAAAPIRHQRTVLAFAVLATATGVGILGSGTGTLALLGGMAILGAPHGLTFPMASAVLAEGVSPAILGRANGRLMASTNLVTIVVPFACGWLAGAVGYRAMFLFLEIPVVVFGLILASALRSFHPPDRLVAAPGPRR